MFFPHLCLLTMGCRVSPTWIFPGENLVYVQFGCHCFWRCLDVDKVDLRLFAAVHGLYPLWGTRLHQRIRSIRDNARGVPRQYSLPCVNASRRGVWAIFNAELFSLLAWSTYDSNTID